MSLAPLDNLGFALAMSDVSGFIAAGAIHLGPAGFLFIDGFESGDTSRWSIAVP